MTRHRRPRRHFKPLLAAAAAQICANAPDGLSHTQLQTRASRTWKRLAPADQRWRINIKTLVSMCLASLSGDTPRPPTCAAPKDEQSVVVWGLPANTTPELLRDALPPHLRQSRVFTRTPSGGLMGLILLPSLQMPRAEAPLLQLALRRTFNTCFVRPGRSTTTRQADRTWRLLHRHPLKQPQASDPYGGRFAPLPKDDPGDHNPAPASGASRPIASQPPRPAQQQQQQQQQALPPPQQQVRGQHHPPPHPDPPTPPPPSPPPPLILPPPQLPGVAPTATLHVATWNARDLRGKEAELEVELLQVHAIDILAVQETWHGANETPDTQGYTWFGRPRPGERVRGGVGLLVADRLAPFCTILAAPSDTYYDPARAGAQHAIEALWISVEAPRAERPMVIGTIYLTPTNDQPATRAATYAAQLEADVQALAGHGNVVLLGDLNAHLEDSAHGHTIGRFHHPGAPNPFGTALRNTLRRLDLRALNGHRAHPAPIGGDCTQCCTFWSADGRGTANDYIITHCNEIAARAANCTVLANMAIGNSDHRPVYAHISYPLRPLAAAPPPGGMAPSPLYATRRLDPAHPDSANVRADYQLRVEEALDDGPNLATLPLDDAAAALTAALRHAADQAIGRRPAHHPHRRPRHPWWDAELRAAALHRRQLASLFNLNHDPATLAALRAAREHGATLATTKRAAFEDNRNTQVAELLDREGPSKSFWRAVNATLGRRPARRIPAVRDPTGALIDDDNTINTAHAAYADSASNGPRATAFDAAHLTSTITALTGIRAAEAAAALTERQLSPITAAEVHIALRYMARDTAPGPDNLPPALFKDGGPALEAVITSLTNRVWSEEAVPSSWQLGTLVPLYKAGDAAEPSNYRPITLGAVLGKIYCQILLSRLTSIVDPSAGPAPGITPLAEEQAGFRRGRGCADHVFILLSTLDDSRSRGLPVIAVFLDFRKAYDSVWRDGLWTKLHQRGVQGKLWRNLVALYSQVRAMVRTNATTSAPISLSTGVRQGCVLSPLLFDLFIDDLVSDLKAEGVGIVVGDRTLSSLLFADDVVLLARSAADMATAFAVVERWCARWRMELNPAKCAALALNYDIAAIPLLCGQPVPRPATVRYLGVEISADGSWTTAANKRATAVTEGGRKLRSTLTNRHLPIPTRLTIFQALARCKADYGSEFIRPSQTATNAIDTEIWRAAKTVMGLPSSTLTAAIELDLGLLGHRDRSDMLALWWLGRISRRPETELTRAYWTACTGPDATIRSATADRIQALAMARGLHPTLTAITTGDQQALANYRSTAQTSILLHRSTRIRADLAAGGTKSQNYLRLIDPDASTRCLPWLRTVGTACDARLRFLLRAGSAPLVEELGRHHPAFAASRAARTCPFCTTGAVEDVAHFVLLCPRWAPQRAVLLHILTESLGNITSNTAGPQAPPLSASAWFASRPPQHQVDMLLGAPIEAILNPAVTTWSARQRAVISACLWGVFVVAVSPMWASRREHIRAFGPIVFSLPNNVHSVSLAGVAPAPPAPAGAAAPHAVAPPVAVGAPQPP